MSFTMQKVLASGYDEALGKVTEALASEGFGVLTEIDVAKTLKAKIGVDFRRYKILGACNPPLAHEALSSSLEVGAMLPCNVIVYEGDDGRAVVHAIDPLRTVAAAEPSLAPFASRVHDKLERVMDKLA